MSSFNVMSQVSDVGILNNNYYLYAQASTTVPKVGVAKNIRGVANRAREKKL